MLNRFIECSKELIDTYVYSNSTKKHRLNMVFNEMSDTLLKASIELEYNRFPYDSCLVMRELTDTILKETEYSKSDERIIKLHRMLSNCSDLKKRYDRNEIPSIICDLRKASRQFKAISMAIIV